VLVYLALGWIFRYVSYQSQKNLERALVDNISRDVWEARKTGELVLWPDFFYTAKEFYKHKLFPMLEHQSGITSLTCYGYPGVPLPVESVKCISTLPDLREVHFRNVWFDENALQGLSGSSLTTISFLGCHIEPKSLNHLSELKQIQSLTLLCPRAFNPERGHELSKEDEQRIIENICTMRQLKCLTLQECFKADIDTLKNNLPDTEITFQSAEISIP